MKVTSEPMKVLRPVDFLNPRIYPNETDRKQEKEITCYNLENSSKKLIQRFERLE
uniref:Transposase n=1 Tax=Syphacia muris TaxID=451379 RepID=A0A0N5AT93_9BILA